MGETPEYGKLYCLKESLKGEWITKAISQMSQLYFYSDTSIKVSPIKTYQASTLGHELSDFLYRSYLVRVYTGKYGTSLDIKNIVLDKCGGDIVNKVSFTDESYRAINIILNHPIFNQCYTVQDFLERIPSVPILKS